MGKHVENRPFHLRVNETMETFALLDGDPWKVGDKMGKHAATHVLIVDDGPMDPTERHLFNHKNWGDLIKMESRTWLGAGNAREFRDWANGLDLSMNVTYRTKIAGTQYEVRKL